jgi:hypothetical protein
VAAYAAREGLDVATYLDRSGPVLTAPQAADAIAQLISDPTLDQPAYLLTAAGLTAVS